MSIEIKDLYNQKLDINAASFQSSESHERLKIARGYYAAFLHASFLFKNDANLDLHSWHPNSKNPQKERYGSHQKIYMSLIHSKIRVLSEVGQKLITYHSLRKKADYELSLDITDDDINDAEECLSYCKERIDFYIKNGNQDFTKSKKVINVKVNPNGKNQIKKLKVLK